jgi:hypothetical protein
MMALLGIEHVERNVPLLSRSEMWPASWQETVRVAHPDLYTRHRDDFVCPHQTANWPWIR